MSAIPMILPRGHCCEKHPSCKHPNGPPTGLVWQSAGLHDLQAQKVQKCRLGQQLTHLDRLSSVHDTLTPDQPVGCVHGDGPHSVLS